MQYIITLVHGTFTKDAVWTQEGSLLRIGLKQLLDGPVEFRCVTWSGRNTVAARAEGTKKLELELRRQMEDTNATLFIVAHSHGGNVALNAMHDEEIRSRVAGVVTMATPFIVASRRLSVYWDYKFFIAGFFVYALMLSYFLYSWFSPYFGTFSYTGSVSMQIMLFVLLLVLARQILIYLEGHSHAILDDIQLPRIEFSKLLILRNAGDEASVALLFSQFLALIPYRLFTTGLALARFLSNRERSSSWCSRFFKLFANTVTGLLVVPLMVAAWIAQMTFNFDVRGNNPFIDVTAEATPPGKWSVHLFVKDRIDITPQETMSVRRMQLKKKQNDPAPELFKANMLIHSYLYSHWEALETIAEWMISRKEK